MEQMRQALTELFEEFNVQMKADPATAYRSLLGRGRQMVLAHLHANAVLDPAIVHLGHKFCYWLDDRQGIIDLMTRYLDQPLALEEEAWARWEQMDLMAGLRQCEAVVERQKKFLDWAKAHLSQDRLLWVMYDSTQSLCWDQVGKGDEWLRIFEEIMGAVVPSPENRVDRFQYLRTAAVMWSAQGKTQEALQLIDRLHRLCDEDVTWEGRIDLKVKTLAHAITTWEPLKETGKIEEIGREAQAFLEEYEQTLPAPLTPSQQHDLGVAYDNVGASLFFAGYYEVSIPLERRAIALMPLYEWIYLRLAAAVWATTKNRTEALAILEQGAAVSNGGRLKLETRPEFTNVIEDPEFLAAATSHYPHA
jgi:tetratricopeptide (TPR) repeat protein